MSKQRIKQIIEARNPDVGLVESGVKGVRLFRVVDPVRCAPAVYEPCIVAIVSGTKEAILHGVSHIYDHNHYMCCPISLPVEAGTPQASEQNPLLGVYISLDPSFMTQLALQIDQAPHQRRRTKGESQPQSLYLSRWDDEFTEALLRLLELCSNPAQAAVLGEGRLRELYFSVLQGDAGISARHAFRPGNEIARAIQFLSERLSQPITIDDLADHVGMSRAVFHRKFKQATTMTPIQFVKSMRLNTAAMKIASGAISVNEAALAVGYMSPSQFSREFKRLYGQSPKIWRQAQQSVAKLL